MRAVYKYKLKLIDDEQSIITFSNPKIVHIDIQDGLPTIWMEGSIHQGAEPDVLEFRIFPTGIPVPDNYFHVGTAVDTLFVWHVYQRNKGA